MWWRILWDRKFFPLLLSFIIIISQLLAHYYYDEIITCIYNEKM